MANDLGVTNLFGITAPTIGYVNESDRKKSIELNTLQDAAGVTVCVSPKPLVKIESSLKGKGDPILGLMVAATLSTKNAIQVNSKKKTEALSEYPGFEVAGVGYADLPSNTPTAFNEDLEIPTAPGSATCPVQGIVSIGISSVTNFDLEEKLKSNDPLLATAGTFLKQDFYDPHFEWSIKGRGDLPAALILGSDGGLPGTVAQFGTGVTVTLSTTESQKNEDYPSFDASGQHWPNAA